MERKEEMQIEFLYQALTEARETIQFVDTKAGTIILLVGGLLAFMGAIHARIDTLLVQILATIMLAALVVAAICAIWALNPRVNPENLIDLKGVTVAPLYFIRSVASPSRWRNWLPFTSANRLEMSGAEYLHHLETLDAEGLRRQLVCELLTVSFIREEKIRQVGWAVRFIHVAGSWRCWCSASTSSQKAQSRAAKRAFAQVTSPTRVAAAASGLRRRSDRSMES